MYFHIEFTEFHMNFLKNLLNKLKSQVLNKKYYLIDVAEPLICKGGLYWKVDIINYQ